ncbi:5'-methylthioadenosine/S-adenosylhomocysteine nucleosidase [Sphingomonas sp.]|uniref:5'-methylthioadenosine/S-adenosylhomocysteine nucleosidase family protein n=1 Tax=Sphingomonas sp. TaxID=28214 RepID=UPI0025FC4E40|nr:5'-methylthioadenosine/S-adenosylhomocysteine nucleosidase [Sphingomonas sp.]
MTSRFQKIGIITGVEAEAKAFVGGRAFATDQVGGLSVARMALGKREIVVVHSGIGKVNAAVAATVLALKYEVDMLLVVGTAGKLSTRAGDCFIITEAAQGDYGAQRPGEFVHYTAGSWPIGPAKVVHFAAEPLPDVGLPSARIVSGDAFVECPDHGAGLRDRLGGDLVDMETAAVAQAAVRLGLPWAAIKATTDDANGESADDFNANLARAAGLAAAALERAIGLLI